MTFYVPQAGIDAILDNIALSTMGATCSASPTTWYNACRPDLWVINTVYSIGDVRHSGNPGFVYECIIGGTSGAFEPAWGTAQDEEFVEGPDTLRWKTHENFALCNVTYVPGDFTIATVSTPDPGRELTIAGIAGVLTHTTGDVTHTAFFIDVTKELTYIAEAETTLVSNNTLTAGRLTVFQESVLLIKFPKELV